MPAGVTAGLFWGAVAGGQLRVMRYLFAAAGGVGCDDAGAEAVELCVSDQAEERFCDGAESCNRGADGGEHGKGAEVVSRSVEHVWHWEGSIPNGVGDTGEAVDQVGIPGGESGQLSDGDGDAEWDGGADESDADFADAVTGGGGGRGGGIERREGVEGGEFAV